eukprot:2818463-Prymnesium_polylepis.1
MGFHKIRGCFTRSKKTDPIRNRTVALVGLGGARFNGSVLPASVERPRHDSLAELHGPSRVCMRHSGGLLYVPN